MKINRGKNVDITSALVISNVEEELVLVNGMFIKVITDETEFDREIKGDFEYLDDETVIVSDERIPIEYIEEIEVL